jgi:hypothetical protein
MGSETHDVNFSHGGRESSGKGARGRVQAKKAGNTHSSAGENEHPGF